MVTNALARKTVESLLHLCKHEDYGGFTSVEGKTSLIPSPPSPSPPPPWSFAQIVFYTTAAHTDRRALSTAAAAFASLVAASVAVFFDAAVLNDWKLKRDWDEGAFLSMSSIPPSSPVLRTYGEAVACAGWWGRASGLVLADMSAFNPAFFYYLRLLRYLWIT